MSLSVTWHVCEGGRVPQLRGGSTGSHREAWAGLDSTEISLPLPGVLACVPRHARLHRQFLKGFGSSDQEFEHHLFKM